MVADTCMLDRRASRARHARARATAAMPDADDSRDDTLPVVCVFGSVNVDHTFRCATALPRAGETVGNATYARAPGGKGANQACAAARTASDVVRDRVGAPSDDPVARRRVRVEFVGCVGAGDEYSLAALRDAGVGTERSRKCEDGDTGTACVLVDANGENCIAVAPGVNARVNGDDVPRCDVLCAQCEVPARENARAIARARELNPDVRVMLNYAPASVVDWGLILSASTVCVNETELAVLRDAYAARRGAARSKNLGVKESDCFLNTLVVTRGERPAQETTVPEDIATSPEARLDWLFKPECRDVDAFFEQRVNIRAETLKVNPEHIVDTVGAGDSFVGAYCASWAMNDSEETRLRIASAAGTLACLEPGARPKSITNARERAREVVCDAKVGNTDPLSPSPSSVCGARSDRARCNA